MSFAEIKYVIRQLLSAVDHMHGRGVLHRDLATKNILFNMSGEIKVCDFGLSRKAFAIDDEHGFIPACPLESPNQIVTLYYRAIELFLGQEVYGPPIDVWSVGCVFACLVRDSPVPYAMGNAEEKEAEDDGQGLLSMIMRGERFPDVPSGTPLHNVILDDCCRFKAGQRISAKRLAEKLAVLDNHDKK